MRHYLKHAGLFFGLIALVPFVTGLFGSFASLAGFMLLFFGLPSALVALAIGTVVFFVHGLRCAGQAVRFEQRAVAVLASPALAASVLLLALPLMALGEVVGDHARLVLNRPRYEAIVDRARADPGSPLRAEYDGLTYAVDPGPPVRVAFDDGPLFDGRSAIVFDPTGAVVLAQGFDPGTGEVGGPEEIAELFGGDLAQCRHLWGAYYKCSFV